MKGSLSTSMFRLVRFAIVVTALCTLASTGLLAQSPTDAPPDERFDLVFSAMTLHHIPDTDGILRRFRAVLRLSLIHI